MIRSHVSQFTADNTDVFGGTLGVQVPPWARLLRIQVLFSDTDLLYSLSVGGQELVRNSGPHRAQADNVQTPDWNSPHIVVEVPQAVTDFEILLDVNVVTAGVGIAVIQWESRRG